MVSFAGLRALVTGGTRGIGASVAHQLCEAGASVTVTGASVPVASTPGIPTLVVDFADDAATLEFAMRVAEEQFDILVNNAGINAVAPFMDIRDEDFDRIHRVNVRAPMQLSRALLSGMRDRGWGRIVNVTSILSEVSLSGRASYSASKFGLHGLTAALAAEVARDGVLANCVAPGFVDTDLTRRTLGEDGMREMASRIPIGRLATSEEISRLIVWVASRENTYVSGQNLVIDGGYTRV